MHVRALPRPVGPQLPHAPRGVERRQIQRQVAGRPQGRVGLCQPSTPAGAIISRVETTQTASFVEWLRRGTTPTGSHGAPATAAATIAYFDQQLALIEDTHGEPRNEEIRRRFALLTIDHPGAIWPAALVYVRRLTSQPVQGSAAS